MKKLYIVLLTFLVTPLLNFSQTATWNFRYEYVTNIPNQVDVFVDIAIPANFHMYSFDQGPGGPIPAEINFNLPQGIKKVGGLQSISKVHEYFDDVFKITARDFSGNITWKQRFNVNTNSDFTIEGSYSYQLCMDDGMCINPFPKPFSIAISAPSVTVKTEQTVQKTSDVDTSKVSQTTPVRTIPTIEPDKTIQYNTEDSFSEIKPKGMSLWWIFIAGFIGGLLAFLTPCVFPMVPMTVSLFIKRSKEKAIRDVIIYGLSIVAIFVTLGIAITLLFGVDALNKLSTDPIFNVAFFIVFVIFAISFFGAFEIMLPSGFVNYIDEKSDTSSGMLGIFFMAFTLVLVSFSCTAMIIGTLLVESVVSGSLLGPFMGMLGFSIALALPFTLFAFFPSMLKKVPKSGGWMNTFKVILGFIELGFALKFLSNADLVAGWGILPRPIFLGIWIVLMIALSLYLLKIIHFFHNTKEPGLSRPRIITAIISLGFTAYLITGYWGNPLQTLSGYLPPTTVEAQNNRKYAELFHSPHGIEAFYDYDEGVAYAKKTNKPILLDFTGKACANCRLIEMNVWSDPEVLELLKKDYVVISLYVDSRDPLEKERIRNEEYGGETYEIRTIGEHWSIFMMKNYGGLMQPYYVLLSPDEKRLAKPITYNEASSIKYFKTFLEKGIKELK